MVIEYKQHIESKPGKPQTPEIFLECYCFAKKKQPSVRKLNRKQEC